MLVVFVCEVMSFEIRPAQRKWTYFSVLILTITDNYKIIYRSNHCDKKNKYSYLSVFSRYIIEKNSFFFFYLKLLEISDTTSSSSKMDNKMCLACLVNNFYYIYLLDLTIENKQQFRSHSVILDLICSAGPKCRIC